LAGVGLRAWVQRAKKRDASLNQVRCVLVSFQFVSKHLAKHLGGTEPSQCAEALNQTLDLGIIADQQSLSPGVL
jgi:hypothetical protein